MNQYTYHILLAEHPTTGVPLLDALCSSFNYVSLDQSGEYGIICCKKQETMEGDHPGLIDYIPSGGYPEWIESRAESPEDCTHEEAKAITRTHGASGSAWQKPLEL